VVTFHAAWEVWLVAGSWLLAASRLTSTRAEFAQAENREQPATSNQELRS
jgi:hypothetical protein